MTASTASDEAAAPAADAHAAVVGAGPSGFYAAEQLLEAGVAVDLFDALPTPFGLVRYGVAPDHPKIKSVVRVYERIAGHSAFRFFGGVVVGEHVMRDDLRRRYPAVVYAVGAAADRSLGISGERRRGVVGATAFVGWYNGHPEWADLAPPLATDRAVVIGNGNVALDVARLLVSDPAVLGHTDIADHALEQLRLSSISEVLVVGRRRPQDASFTPPELRELGRLADVDLDLALDGTVGGAEAGSAALAALHTLAERPSSGARRRIVFRFHRSPLAVTGSGSDGPVSGLRLAVNHVEIDELGHAVARPSGIEETVECGLIVTAIGYRSAVPPGLPYDPTTGCIPHRHGRIVDPDGHVLPGEYVTGWCKRGPTGVIGTNKRDSAETVGCVLEDLALGNWRTLEGEGEGEGEGEDGRLPGGVGDAIDWSGWQALDRHEQAAGRPLGRPRVKLTRLAHMRAVAR